MLFDQQPVLYSVDLGGCVRIAALATTDVSATFAAALESAGATVVGQLSHCFPDAGLTCVLILAESHAVLHTWPETGTVNIDIFSCSTRLQSLSAIEALGLAFGAASVSVREVPRVNGRFLQSAPAR